MKSLPEFPKFRKINIDAYEDYVNFTNNFDKYSDFNFISLFSWNTDDTVGISTLNKNLVIMLPDYITGTSVYSLLGSNKINASIEELMSLTKIIRLVPEEVVSHLEKSHVLIVEEDKDNFDYIYSLESLSFLEGRAYKWKRKRLNQLLRTYDRRISFENFTQNLLTHRARIISIFDKWTMQNNKDPGEAEAERLALENILKLSEITRNIILTILCVDGKDIGLSVNELGLPTSTCHFQKSLKDIANIDILLTNYTSTLLLKNKSEFINWEQDLGIEGLRQFKQSYRPTKFLKKYSISIAEQ